MQSRFERWEDRFLPPGSIPSTDVLKKHRNLVFVCFLTGALALTYCGVSVVVGFPVGVYTMAASGLAMAALPFLVKRGMSRTVVANIYIGIIFLDTVLITTTSGGLSTSITSPYVAIIPMLGLMLIGARAGLIWFLVVVAEVLILGIAELAGVDFPMTFDADVDAAFKLAAFLGLVVIIFLIVRDFDAIAQTALHQVEEEREKSQALLLNILPEEVAEELKATGRAQAREFDEVTVLFSDFQNFTEISSDMTPTNLVEELNTCFYAFDSIMRDHGLEKIKTIGDAYMAVSGLALGEGSSPSNVLQAALQMQQFMNRHVTANRTMGKPAFEMRIGVHSGPVVAGVVGDTKFQYDVWGDTVNTAFRLEAAGAAGEVNVSGTTFALVEHHPAFQFEHRGKVEVKGKGEIDMYFARSAQPSEADASETARGSSLEWF
jgi:class 3 adenylate cyclase